jgi:hypothetical protein
LSVDAGGRLYPTCGTASTNIGSLARQNPLPNNLAHFDAALRLVWDFNGLVSQSGRFYIGPDTSGGGEIDGRPTRRR